MTASFSDQATLLVEPATAATFRCRLCEQPVRARRWGGGECERCGSTSVHVTPSDAELAAFYANYNERYTGGGASEGRNLERYARRYLQIVRRWRRSGRLIDIGSSNNPFPNHAARAGSETSMMDFSRPAQLDHRVHFIEGHMNDERALDAGRAAFDIVTSWAVMEHVPDPRRSAQVLSALCKPGGLIVLSTPEAGTLLTRHAIGHSPWFYPPEHLNLISPRALELMFEPLGCELRHWGRLELSWPRFVARYGIGAASALTGALARGLAATWWRAQRDLRKQRFQGITYFVLEKTAIDKELTRRLAL
jgi:SAM-dependent methyltransferase